MIDKKISISEQVADLSVHAQLVFTWSIPHTDDVGLLPASHRTLKALIVPMWDSVLLAEFTTYVDEIVSAGLWQEIEYKDKSFFHVVKFKEHQTLRRDRQPNTFLEIESQKKPQDTWQALDDLCHTIGIPVTDSGMSDDSNGLTEEKVSKEKVSKEKRKKNSLNVSKADYGSSILNHWNEQKIIVHKKFTKDAEKEVSKLFAEEVEVEDIKNAITTYSTVYHGKEYWWTHKWNLYEFLKRGLKQFDGKSPEDYAKDNRSSFESEGGSTDRI